MSATVQSYSAAIAPSVSPPATVCVKLEPPLARDEDARILELDGAALANLAEESEAQEDKE